MSTVSLIIKNTMYSLVGMWFSHSKFVRLVTVTSQTFKKEDKSKIVMAINGTVSKHSSMNISKIRKFKKIQYWGEQILYSFLVLLLKQANKIWRIALFGWPKPLFVKLWYYITGHFNKGFSPPTKKRKCWNFSSHTSKMVGSVSPFIPHYSYYCSLPHKLPTNPVTASTYTVCPEVQHVHSIDQAYDLACGLSYWCVQESAKPVDCLHWSAYTICCTDCIHKVQ